MPVVVCREGTARPLTVSYQAGARGDDATGQFSPQAPGPSGCPHCAQGDEPGSEVPRRASVPTANTDSCLSSAGLSHDGHTGNFDPVTIVSNRWWHVRQTYSKIGMPLF